MKSSPANTQSAFPSLGCIYPFFWWVKLLVYTTLDGHSHYLILCCHSPAWDTIPSISLEKPEFRPPLSKSLHKFSGEVLHSPSLFSASALSSLLSDSPVLISSYHLSFQAVPRCYQIYLNFHLKHLTLCLPGSSNFFSRPTLFDHCFLNKQNNH